MAKFNPPHNSPTLSPPFSLLPFPTPTSLPSRPLTNFYPLHFPHRSALLRRRQNPKFKVIRGCLVKEGELLGAEEEEEAELLFTTCITRTLPPALTLEHGLKTINAAVEELKSNPPSRSTRGMY